MSRLCISLAVEAATLKNYGFEEENEWRVISIEMQPEALHIEKIQFHEGKWCQIPHLELPLVPEHAKLYLDSITIGPNPLPKEDVINSVSLMCNKFGVNCEEVVHSETPFRNW